MVFSKLFTAIQIAIVFCTFKVADTTPNIQSKGVLGNHIEVIGDMLTADTKEPLLDVEEIVLSGVESYRLSGCPSSRCSHNITRVKHGIYEATLITSTGSISETVIIE